MPFTLTIRERNDSWAGRQPTTSTHKTREEAEAALYEYVRQNWGAEVGTRPPSDPGKMAEEYFAEVLESYDITEHRFPAQQG